MKLALVGDIGGTNARFALWKNHNLENIQVLATADYACPEDAIKVYLSGMGMAPGAIGSVCLSVAGPVSGDEFRFTNNHWRLSNLAFCKTLEVEKLLLVNDFSAMALGMTRLRPDEYRVVCEGTPEPRRPAVVIGPGTGLGVGTLLDLGDGRFAALPGEGGHVDLPMSSPRETQLWQHIYNEIGHVSAETALSGSGLPRVYRAICAVDGHTPVLDTPESITAAGLAGDPIALEVLEQFCCWLGRVAGNNVLTLGGRGGVYIVGGVVPRFADFFLESGFARCFADKGCMSDYFKGIPVWLVTAPYSGLMGAGVALEQSTPV
ncbi:glucokinase [Pseudomonas viciae]|uniref:Glucokinase n=1 Tax=Pseudomonas viciae TaxID=2505979 RepID=A0A4P7PCZ0_9PSED|nr:glucokinase [Pseudomonas viciae]QBZ88389.1 glucokinase [Pseudomonas viciae]UZE87749.1 glucokinase [Pseudomonas viciae]WGO94717.1 glucokinase [Pseudomonas viciae]